MAYTSHVFKLGKDHTFTFPGIVNQDVKDVTITIETSAEADITTRGSDNYNEYAPVRKNTTMEVTVLAHSALIHSTGAVTITLPSGASGSGLTGIYYVNNISEPQALDDAVVYTISLRKYLGA